MKNEITTIQLRENVKRALEKLKEKQNESYEDVIVKLIDKKNKDKKELERMLIQECKEMYGENLRIVKEWEGTLLDGEERE